jgi:hypothetical protein
VSAVTVRLRATDREGHAVADLRSSDLEVSEDGKPARTLELSRLGFRPAALQPAAGAPARAAAEPAAIGTHQGWDRVMIWVVPEMTHRGSMPRSVEKLRRAASRPVALAPVAVVVEDGAPGVISAGAKTPEALERSLADRSLARTPWNRILRTREDFLLRDGLGFPGFAYRFALAAASDEFTLVQSHLGMLAGWAGEHAPGHGAGLIILVASGFGDGTTDFYESVLAALLRAHLEIPDKGKVAQLESFRLDRAIQGVTDALTRAGWVMVTLDTGAQWATDTHFASPLMKPSCTSCLPPLEPELIRHPGVSSHRLAENTGGGVVKASESMASALDRFAGVYRLVYQADRPPDEREHRVAIACRRPGVEVIGSSTVSQAPSGSQAVSRAVASLATLDRGSGLEVTARVVRVKRFGRRLQGSLKVDVALPGRTEQGREAHLRVTVAVAMEKGEPFVHQEDFAVNPEAGEGRWRLSSPIEWSPDALRISVLVEDLGSGGWGVAKADLPGTR